LEDEDVMWGLPKEDGKMWAFFGERGFENDIVLWIRRGIQTKEAWWELQGWRSKCAYLSTTSTSQALLALQTHHKYAKMTINKIIPMKFTTLNPKSLKSKP
jgi:hypothetical protein